jgi:hypothetical protein
MAAVATCDRCGYSATRTTAFHIVARRAGVPASDPIRSRATLGGELCERCAPVLTSNRRLRWLAIGAFVIAGAAGGIAEYLAGPRAAIEAAALPVVGLVVALVMLASWHHRVSRDILGDRLLEKLVAGLPEAGGPLRGSGIRVFWGSARNPIRIEELGRAGRPSRPDR